MAFLTLQVSYHITQIMQTKLNVIGAFCCGTIYSGFIAAFLHPRHTYAD